MHSIYHLRMMVTKMIDRFIYNFLGVLDKASSWIDNMFNNKKKRKK